MEVDISVDRECVDGQGVITVLTGDLDSVIYSIDGGNTFVNTPQFTGLNVGTYNIVAKDTTGCQVDSVIEIEPFLEVGPVLVTPSCANPTGEIDIRGNLGLPLYQYSFDGGQSFFTDSVKTELPAGSYNVVIKDSYGCEVDTNLTVDGFPTISPTITTTNQQCNGSGPGSVDVLFSDGANYSFSLNNGNNSSGTSFNDATLNKGFYVLEITDQYGCTSPFQFEVEADEVDDTVQVVNEVCHYEDGQIQVFGFLGEAPYEYSIDNGTTFSPTGIFTDLTQGIYVVQVKDATGCIKNDTVYIANFGGVDAFASEDDTVCLGNDIIVAVSHNAGPSASYNWDNGLSNGQSHTVSPSTTTTYTVEVTDIYGCKDTTETIVYVENFPSIVLSESNIRACIGDDIDLQVFGAERYEWSTGSTTDIIDYTAIGNETVTVTGYNGQCSDQEQIVIIIKPSPTAIASANATSINTGESITFSNAGSITSTTTWEFGDGGTSMMSNPTYQFDFPGAYMVMLTSEMGDCEAKDSILVYVGTVSINENTNSNIIVYPNPAKEQFNLDLDDSARLQLFTSTGKLVFSKEVNKGLNTILIDHLARGIYIGKINSSTNYSQFRLVLD